MVLVRDAKKMEILRFWARSKKCGGLRITILFVGFFTDNFFCGKVTFVLLSELLRVTS